MVFREKRYRPPLWLYNGHIHTFYASKYRVVSVPSYERERWTTPDKDFLDIDIHNQKSNKAIILSHGLEGSSRRPYMNGLANLFISKGYDVCAWNCRSCSGELNRNARLYNHGEIEDIEFVTTKLLNENKYSELILAGFSMGGAIIMNWLAKRASNIPAEVRAGIAISSPCDIKAASRGLEFGINKVYRNYFMKKLAIKIKAKAKQFPGWLDLTDIDQIKTWKEFDERFSAPLGNYENAEDFYFHCSTINRLDKVRKPLLLINAKDDPILSNSCYPTEAIRSSDSVHAIYPRKGGHVAFIDPKENFTLAERYTYHFAEAILNDNQDLFLRQFEKL